MKTYIIRTIFTDYDNQHPVNMAYNATSENDAINHAFEDAQGLDRGNGMGIAEDAHIICEAVCVLNELLDIE